MVRFFFISRSLCFVHSRLPRAFLKTSKQPAIITGEPLYFAKSLVALLRTNRPRSGKRAPAFDAPLSHLSTTTGVVLFKQPCSFQGPVFALTPVMCLNTQQDGPTTKPNNSDKVPRETDRFVLSRNNFSKHFKCAYCVPTVFKMAPPAFHSLFLSSLSA